MAIETKPYVRKPIYVEAVQVTEENFLELAFWTKGTIMENETNNGVVTGAPINSDVQHIKVPVVNARNAKQGRAHVGDWILKSKTRGPDGEEKEGLKVYTDEAFVNAFDPVQGTEAEAAPPAEEAEAA